MALDPNGTSWLADGVKEIERIVKAGTLVTPQLLALPQEKPGTYAIVTPAAGGDKPALDVRVAQPIWHNERLETPQQLARFINSVNGVKTEELADDDQSRRAGAVFIGPERIVFVFDANDRRDRATCPLMMSQQWAWLTTAPSQISQRDAIRALRITFAGALPPGSPLIDILRKIVWTNNANVETDLQRGKEALGKQILNKASGVADFPEEFLLNVPVFENYPQTVAVRVALEIYPDRQAFELAPFPNELTRGMTQTLAAIQREIEEATNVPTFLGVPSNGKE